MHELVEPTRLEAGCLNYDLHQSIDDADVWFVYENWGSPQDLDAHMKTEGLRKFLDLAASLLEGEIDLRRFAMRSRPAVRRG